MTKAATSVDCYLMWLSEQCSDCNVFFLQLYASSTRAAIALEGSPLLPRRFFPGLEPLYPLLNAWMLPSTYCEDWRQKKYFSPESNEPFKLRGFCVLPVLTFQNCTFFPKCIYVCFYVSQNTRRILPYIV
jgi:hypothetical protein